MTKKVRTSVDEQKNIPAVLSSALHNIYTPAGLNATQVFREKESNEYSACRLKLNDYSVIFRQAKTTPTKIGLFVTCWKRLHFGAEIIPFDFNDGIDFFIVAVSDETHSGQFVFSKKILIEKGIMSHRGHGGKLAFRVYPPWSKPLASAAIKTQQWQIKHFFMVLNGGFAESIDLVQQLFKS